MSCDSRSHQNKTTKRQVAEMTKSWLPVTKQTLFSSSWMPLKMSSWMRYSFFSAIRMVTVRNPMIAIRNVHVLDLSCSKQLVISNQNTHAFRPNFHCPDIITDPKSIFGQRGPEATKPVQPGPNHSHAAWNCDVSLRFISALSHGTSKEKREESAILNIQNMPP